MTAHYTPIIVQDRIDRLRAEAEVERLARQTRAARRERESATREDPRPVPRARSTTRRRRPRLRWGTGA
ncbi:hypothetical protein ACTWP5_14355 [Streptomyces sp. 4N509B]|uniref:hypothetical protein n=1 Tax=Streptomyces sp. 4N509B TaxID=3457413 RepID=UPI003FD58373